MATSSIETIQITRDAYIAVRDDMDAVGEAYTGYEATREHILTSFEEAREKSTNTHVWNFQSFRIKLKATARPSTNTIHIAKRS